SEASPTSGFLVGLASSAHPTTAVRFAMRVAASGMALTALICLTFQPASAQTVQLPTFTFFSVGTTVSVPDQGAAFLGGVNRASQGRNEFGIPGMAFPGLQSR